MEFFLSLCFLLPPTSLETSASSESVSVDKVAGDDCELQCGGPKDTEIKTLEWIRPDLISEGYVLFYRDGRPLKLYQHPSFTSRVQLKDPELKNGELSVKLTDLKPEDSGTYQCLAVFETPIGTEEFSQSFHLNVREQIKTAKLAMRDNTEEGGGATVEIVVAVIVAVAVVCALAFALYKRHHNKGYCHQNKTTDSPQQQPLNV